MIAIRLRFITGRWHATAWGSHVNEGVPDWPPAPWRIVRALIAIWFHKHSQMIDEAKIRQLVDALAAAAPSYALPSATSAHTRHYMPINEGGKEKRTKIFDTFVHVAPEQYITVLWPVDIDCGQRELLAALLGGLNYLGRAESLVEAILLPTSAELPAAVSRPISEESPLRRDEQPIRLLAPLTPADYNTWVQERTGNKPKPKGGKKGKGAELPASLFDALLVETSDLKAAGWSQPPGSKWVDYARPAEPFQIAPRREPVPDDRLPTIARFAIVSAVPPGITQALSLGERFHRALVSRCPSPVFTGCNESGNPLSGHSHAHYLSEADPDRGTVKFLTIYARMGFDADARRALEKLRQTWGFDGHDLQLILLGTGERNEFSEQHRSPGTRLLDSANVWISHTPFVPTRHLKTRKNGEPKRDASGLAIGSPEHELRRLLQEESKLRVAAGESAFPEVISVEPVPTAKFGSRRIPWLDYQRTRKYGNGQHAMGNRGFGFRITFSDEVSGPLAFGYGAHFGLGLFVPAGVETAPTRE